MNNLVKEIREALKPHHVDGFTAICYPMPTLQQVERLITEVERVSGEALKLIAERNELLSLESQYTQRLGEMARLSDIVCTWVLEHGNLDEDSPEVKAAAEEIMEYVEAVRP